MLQQTQVATVVPYYDRFLSRFPGVQNLASAEEEQVLRLWEGLGYYRRARQLHAAARQIVAQHGGQFPTDYDSVRSLPGIGRYTAGAVLSIGLDARLPILEANTIRVFSRLAGFRGDPATGQGQKYLWSLAESLLPAKRTGAFNQALMELGSEICTPKAPDCSRCPISAHCQAFATGMQQLIPVAPKKTKYQTVYEVAVVIKKGNRILLRKCSTGERWAGLWDFPRFPLTDSNAALPANLPAVIGQRVAELTGVSIEVGAKLATLKHGVTRFRITLDCFEAGFVKGASPRVKASGELLWATTAELAELPLSTTGRKISRLVTTGQTTRAAAVRRADNRQKRG
jgi:A/G-specific adenine glycosylase